MECKLCFGEFEKDRGTDWRGGFYCYKCLVDYLFATLEDTQEELWQLYKSYKKLEKDCEPTVQETPKKNSSKPPLII